MDVLLTNDDGIRARGLRALYAALREAGHTVHDENGIIVNGRHIAVTRCKAGEWEWERLGVTLAVETTGTIKDKAGLAQHLACGAKKVVISAPGKDVDAMVSRGANQRRGSIRIVLLIINLLCKTLYLIDK